MLLMCRCLDVLRDFGSDDCELSANICKLLCNYSAEVPIMSSSPCAFFTQQEVTQLTGLLDVYLGGVFSSLFCHRHLLILLLCLPPWCVSVITT